MGMNTYRLLIIVLILNTLIFTMAEAFRNNHQDNYNVGMDNEVELILQNEEDFESDAGIWGSMRDNSNIAQEDSIGNSIKWGFTIFKGFMRGILPIPLEPELFDTELEYKIGEILNFFIHILTYVLMIEAYFVFKNKKTS